MNQNSYFSKEELKRYNRHIIIPDFGMEAQEKLKKSSVLVVGAGGLGSPALLYLAAAGVGHIGIVDCDVVEDSNLQRQVLFNVDEIGVLKTEAAKKRLQALNPYIKITLHHTQFTSQNALEIAKDYDVLADGTDNFPTRYLVNDTAVLLGKVNVYASIFQFEGQVTVFNQLNAQGERGPNYRDLFPQPPDPGAVPNCSEAGVLGVLPGIIGSLQALEVIKVITGVGETLNGRLYLFDALTFQSRTFNIKRNAANPLNGEHPTQTKLIDYEQFCGVKAMERVVKQVTPAEFVNWQNQGVDVQLIDVREPHEYELVNIGSQLIPLGIIGEHANKIDQNKRVVIMCKSGVRSAKAIRLLEDKYGMGNLYNMEGGILNYINEMELDLPVY
ncbi:adenylyltransferase/sulfurtransferase [Pedobacter sp. CAN_A7]|uniref:molybdopterin-synthase adenylyltransferase MoeB n=1 Tax=Pedobacter sp. CAN_A7 TaxID=2787722 RepID=UPI0018CA3676